MPAASHSAPGQRHERPMRGCAPAFPQPENSAPAPNLRGYAPASFQRGPECLMSASPPHQTAMWAAEDSDHGQQCSDHAAECRHCRPLNAAMHDSRPEPRGAQELAGACQAGPILGAPTVPVRRSRGTALEPQRRKATPWSAQGTFQNRTCLFSFCRSFARVVASLPGRAVG